MIFGTDGCPGLGEVFSTQTSAVLALPQFRRGLTTKTLDHRLDNWFRSNPIRACASNARPGLVLTPVTVTAAALWPATRLVAIGTE